MAILVDEHTTCLVQGLTGKEGQKAADWMRKAGTHVIAGVTPGKGGQVVDGAPIYNSVKEALVKHPDINATAIYVPAKFSKSAALEAIEAGIPLIHIIAENVPTRDTAEIYAAANKAHVRVLGPSSIGIISPGKGKMGSIGGEQNEQCMPGSVGIISKSGGMSSEICTVLTMNKIGQSTVIGIGGDVLIGTTFADLLPLFEKDKETKAVVMIGELGGTYEEQAAAVLKAKRFTKPLIAFISGLFAETLPQGVSFGHAGAIVDSKLGTRKGKIEELTKAGAHVVKSPEEIVEVVKRVIG
ncbi:MAG TPA: CoA-binding protein [Candidatus Saccharimonadia bacterium]|nr:CoA-binding protein [Candidatus Saccharimonadia bacterium]